MKLLERDHFILELSRLFEKVKTETGFVVTITGEAGIGKTSLVEHFTQQNEGNAEVFWGSCDDLFALRPLAPLYDIASKLNSHIVSQLDSGAPRPSIFSTFLQEIQLSGPNIIVIEDVHWADESTLDLINFLARRISKCKSLLIITYRDDEITSGHPLKQALSSIPSNYHKRIKLTPLSKGAVNSLALSHGRKDENLYAKTNGNPLLVTEVLTNDQIETPSTIKELMASKLKRLSSDSRNAVEIFSVIPGKVEKWLAQKLIKDFSLIDEAIEFGILKSEGNTILFRHELARMAVEESLSESKRINFNSNILNILLEQKNEDHLLARIIHHAAKSGDSDVIIKYAPIAAKQASKLGAHKQAAKHYQTALKFSEQLSLEEHLSFLEGRSYECFITGQIQEAIQATEDVIKILKKYHSPEREGEIYRRLSRILWYDCQDEKGEEYLNKAIAIFEKLPISRQLALAYSNKSQTYAIREDTETAILWGEKALELARKLNDAEIEAHALNNIGNSKMLVEDKSGEYALLRSLEISLQNEYYEHVTRAYVNLGSVNLQQKNLREAEKYFSKGLEYGNEKDIYIFSLCMAGHYAKTKLFLGDWDKSIELANLVLNKESVPPGNTVMPINVIAVIRARRNDPGALKLINESFALAIRMGELEKIVSISAGKAEYFWLHNKLEDITEELNSTLSKVKKSNNPWAIGEIAYWLWKAGALSKTPEKIAKPFKLQIEGKWREAAKLWDELHCPYEQALALSEGDEDAIKKAIEIFDKLGASATSQLIKQKMRATGIRNIPKGPRQSTRDNIAGLTSRQVQVLRLLSKGLSNSDIANNLFISPKTVDHHISAIFSKLNIHSRTEAAAFIHANGTNKI
ncbi:MAG: LuxR C-terminal-related transcriptional regulator [Ignavibacteriaceae bacterium]|nr:LuxR C-terminal-related transcriptional regulator [Ignavibacteriaceae bacterium]